MRKKEKQTIILILTAVFLIMATYLLISAQGLALDFRRLKIIRTGGLYLKFEPSDAVIKINGRIHKNQPRFGDKDILIKKLLPGNYQILLAKDGYHDWQKELVVKPGLVTSARQVRLWSQSPKIQIIGEKIKDFWLTRRGLIYQNLDNSVNFQNHILRGEKMIFNDNRSDIVITNDNKNNFLINLDTPTTAINIDQLFNSLKQRRLALPGNVSIKKFFAHPFSDSKIVIATQKAAYVLDFKKIELEQLLTTDDLIALNLSNTEVFAIDSDNNLIAANLVFKRIASTSLDIVNIDKIEPNRDGTKLFLSTKTSELMMYDRSSQKVEKLGDDIKDFYPTSDGKRIALITEDQKLKIYYLEDYELDYKIPAGSFSEVAIPDAILSNFSWLTNPYNYFIARIDENLMISEVDPRSPQNSNIVFSDVKKYLTLNKEIYVLKNANELIKFAAD